MILKPFARNQTVQDANADAKSMDHGNVEFPKWPSSSISQIMQPQVDQNSPKKAQCMKSVRIKFKPKPGNSNILLQPDGNALRNRSVVMVVRPHPLGCLERVVNQDSTTSHVAGKSYQLHTSHLTARVYCTGDVYAPQNDPSLWWWSLTCRATALAIGRYDFLGHLDAVHKCSHTRARSFMHRTGMVSECLSACSRALAPGSEPPRQ